MKRLLLVTIIATATVLMSGCRQHRTGDESASEIDYRQEMRDFVQAISAYAQTITTAILKGSIIGANISAITIHHTFHYLCN